MTCNSSVTFPDICDTPLMLTDSDPLFGVKTTLKRVAEKLELAMHGFSEFDSSNAMAEARGRKADSAAKSTVMMDNRDMVRCEAKRGIRD